MEMLPEIPDVSVSGRPGNLRKGATSVKSLTKYENYTRCVESMPLTKCSV